MWEDLKECFSNLSIESAGEQFPKFFDTNEMYIFKAHIKRFPEYEDMREIVYLLDTQAHTYHCTAQFAKRVNGIKAIMLEYENIYEKYRKDDKGEFIPARKKRAKKEE